ncbi:NADH-quinone oxidoreductase subunit I [Bacteroidetes/Chlorobi group bacterium ChocPot_Mid]|jgi:NADH-quinone oxidoreductase subunit I|nr:MAG: NADH-quinone oxidoreductase subunit I [Bacteroidetes/Chlorobi group bacterium ChocPot_Mid]
MLNYFKNMWLGVYTVLVGLRLTLIHLFSRNVTVQYPDERYPIPPNARNRLYLDPELCDACLRCAKACPVNCISIESLRAVPGLTPPLKNGDKRNLWVTHYEIDFAKCCFCGLCTEPCPTNAINTTTEFEYSTTKREDLIYTFVKMSDEEKKEKEEQLAIYQAEQKKKKAAEAEAKAKAEAEAKTKAVNETKNDN